MPLGEKRRGNRKGGAIIQIKRKGSLTPIGASKGCKGRGEVHEAEKKAKYASNFSFLKERICSGIQPQLDLLGRKSMVVWPQEVAAVTQGQLTTWCSMYADKAPHTQIKPGSVYYVRT